MVESNKSTEIASLKLENALDIEDVREDIIKWEFYGRNEKHLRLFPPPTPPHPPTCVQLYPRMRTSTQTPTQFPYTLTQAHTFAYGTHIRLQTHLISYTSSHTHFYVHTHIHTYINACIESLSLTHNHVHPHS